MCAEIKLEPMSNTSFKLMTWLFKLNDNLFPVWEKPEQHVQKMPLQKGMVVVDYACGPGRYTIPLAEMVGSQGKVYAVDIQPLAIETVKKKTADRSLTNIQPILVDSYHTGIPDGSVDMVLLLDAIQSIEEPIDLLVEIHRLLKKGGILFMDSGHMKTEEVSWIVESSDLFTITRLDDRDMLLKRNDNRADEKGYLPSQPRQPNQPFSAKWQKMERTKQIDFNLLWNDW
jgi:ubiquinone/menaquinone biosynthesis C-methylase UbiE